MIEGEVVQAVGSHEELIETNRYYYDFASRSLQSGEWARTRTRPLPPSAAAGRTPAATQPGKRPPGRLRRMLSIRYR